MNALRISACLTVFALGLAAQIATAEYKESEAPTNNAGVVTVGALTYDGAANPDVITDSLNGYEWLRWNVFDDLTLGETQTAITSGAYAGQGWMIASNAQALQFVDAVLDPAANPCTTSGNFSNCGDPVGDFRALVGNNCSQFNNETLTWFLSDNGVGDEAGVIDHFQNTNNLLFWNERTSIALANTWTCPIPWLVYREAPTGPAPGSENGIVGSWFNITAPDPAGPNAGGPVILTLFDNGQFQFGQDGDSVADPNGMDGLEWGTYVFDGDTLVLSNGGLDTNGEWGFAPFASLPVTLDGNTLTLNLGDDGDFVFTRVDSESLVGAWVVQGLVDDETASITFMEDNTFMVMQGNNPSNPCNCGQAGIEYGTYSWNPVSGVLSTTIITDTNGQFGLSDPLGVASYSLTLLDDQLIVSDIESFLLDRVRAADGDFDGVPDFSDNCTTIQNPLQIDSNADGFGNLCDPDLNNDGIVNFADIGLWAPFFNTATGGNPAAEDADFTGDGLVNFTDYTLYPLFFLNPPGPSAVAPVLLDMTNRTASSSITISTCPGVSLGWDYTFTSTSMTLDGSDGTLENCVAAPPESVFVDIAALASDFDIPFNCEFYPLCSDSDFNKTLSGVDGDGRPFTSTYSYAPFSNKITYIKTVEDEELEEPEVTVEVITIN